MTYRVGLVLGSGGPAGHAFHAGLLHAIEAHTGWSPSRADLLVGTSAGAQVAALVRAGMPAADISARVRGEALSDTGARIAREYFRPAHGWADVVRRIEPASPHYLGRVFRRPWEARPGALLAALVPAGRVSLTAQAEGFNRMFREGWPAEALWIPAVDLDSGELVVFGRDPDVECDVGTAVAASGAVPAINEPVAVGQRRFVDGAVRSFYNADLLVGDAFDAVLVLTPLWTRRVFRLLAVRELQALRRVGTNVAVLHPTAPVARAIGRDLFATARMGDVARAAYASFEELASDRRIRRVLDRITSSG